MDSGVCQLLFTFDGSCTRRYLDVCRDGRDVGILSVHVTVVSIAVDLTLSCHTEMLLGLPLLEQLLLPGFLVSGQPNEFGRRLYTHLGHHIITYSTSSVSLVSSLIEIVFQNLNCVINVLSAPIAEIRRPIIWGLFYSIDAGLKNYGQFAFAGEEFDEVRVL